MTWKTVLAGTSALALIGSTLAFAQQQSTDPSPPAQSMPSGTAGAPIAAPDQPGATMSTERRDYGRPTDRDYGANQERGASAQSDNAVRVEQGLARFKNAMRLTADQEKNWPAFEAAARGFAMLRLAQVEARRKQSPPSSPVERLRRGSDVLTNLSAALKRLADAEEPLYNSLDDGQKQRFVMLSRMARQRLAMLARGGGPESRESRAEVREDWRDDDDHGWRGGRHRWRDRDDDYRDGGWRGHHGMGGYGRDDDDDHGGRDFGRAEGRRGEGREEGGRGRREGRGDDDGRSCGWHRHHHDFGRGGDDDDGWGGHGMRGMMDGRDRDETTGSDHEWRERGFDRDDFGNRRGEGRRHHMRSSDDDYNL